MYKNNVYKKISRQLLNTIEQFNEYDKKARTFGTDYKLHFSEIHLIEFIGNNKNCYVSEIAKGTKVTKGAVSQMVKKLERRGYLFKTIDTSNKARTLIHLTKKGQKAFDEHNKYHIYLDNLVAETLEGLSHQEITIIFEFLKKMECKWK